MNLNNLISIFELQSEGHFFFIWEPPEILVSLRFLVPVNLIIECCPQQSITELFLMIFTIQYFPVVFIFLLISISHHLAHLQMSCHIVHCFSTSTFTAPS